MDRQPFELEQGAIVIVVVSEGAIVVVPIVVVVVMRRQSSTPRCRGGGGGPLRPEEARSSPAEWDYMKHAITWGWLWCVVPTTKKQAQPRPHLVLREIKRCDGEKIELSK